MTGWMVSIGEFLWIYLCAPPKKEAKKKERSAKAGEKRWWGRGGNVVRAQLPSYDDAGR